ncbi:MAG TPA: hypothetical protein VFT43_09195, partial [Candidatus Polarisedimenticolia bacterium]|nr:hypothetical protein [Candidatus Polarisedimenticolia bacterium]
LAQRHRLPIGLAQMVADNRLTVQKALAQKAAIESREPPRPQTSVSHGVWNFMVFSIGTLILAGLGVHIYGVWGEYLAERGASILAPRMASAAPRFQPPAAPAVQVPQPPPPFTVPRTDSTGQLVEVVGPDPRSVLIVFCTTGRQSGQRQPVEIAPTVPPSASMRLGVFRHVDQPGFPLRAVRIHRDPDSGRWVAGDGRTPILTETPPSQPSGARSIPVAPDSPAASQGPGGA